MSKRDDKRKGHKNCIYRYNFFILIKYVIIMITNSMWFIVVCSYMFIFGTKGCMIDMSGGWLTL